MKIKQHTILLSTQGRGFYELTQRIQDWVFKSQIREGLCHLFIQHTSASLLITENADPSVRRDLETFLSQLCADGDPSYTHCFEGDDDMAAHLRTALTLTSVSIPIMGGKLGLGTWQGIFLWEHRFYSHRRKVVLTLMGTP